jgi:hypothetical protein
LLVDNITLEADTACRSIDFGFRDPGNRLPYQVKSMTGLDADEIVTNFAGHLGSSVTAHIGLPTLVKREVVLLLGLNPDWGTPSQTFSSLRDDLYRLVGACPSGMLYVKFNYGEDTVAQVLGRISKVEAAHFTDTPQVQLTIAVEEYPMLESPVTTADDDPDWVARAALTPSTTEALLLTDNESTAPHSFYAQFTFVETTKNFKMEGLGELEGLAFEINSFTFIEDDVLHIQGHPKDRKVYVRRPDGTAVHLVDKMSDDSVWPLMYPGDNYYTWATSPGYGLWYYGTTGETPSRAVCTRLSWTSTYWGV